MQRITLHFELRQAAQCLGILLFLFLNMLMFSSLQGQIPGISLKEQTSDCGTCTGKLLLSLPEGLAVPLEVELKDSKKTKKITINSNTSTTDNPVFEQVCPGEYQLTFTSLAEGFKGLACAKKIVKGVMKGSGGDAPFTVTLVSNANQRIEVSTNATNPMFAWSVGGNTTNVLENAPSGSHTVTVTDVYGCKKTAGPFAIAGGCYNASGVYTGTKFEIVLEQANMIKPVLINMFDPITLKIKVNIGGTIQSLPSDYTITWKTASGQVIGTESSLLITPSMYSIYQAQSLSVVVTNPCETRQIPIKLQVCGGGDPQALKEIFTTTTEASCKAENNVDLKTGSITVSVPLPKDGVYGVSVMIGTQNLAIQADVQGKKGTAKAIKLAAGNHIVRVLYGTSNSSCAYSFTVDVPGEAPAYKFVDFANGQCNFKAICKNGSEIKLNVPPARVYSTQLGSNSSDLKSKCQPKVDCVLGNVTETRLNGGTIDAIRTYAGIFEDVIHTVLSDPNNQLSAKEREALDKECQDNKQRFDCRVVKFCPGSFTVIDDGKPFAGFKWLLRQHNHDITSANCRELSCGKGGKLEVFSTCDPKLASAVNITNPQGPNGGICNTPPPPPDEPEDKDDSGNTCQVWKKKVPLSQIYYNEEYRGNPFYQGSQINQIIDALDARIQAVDAITKRGDAKERFLLNSCISISYCETNLKVNGINFSNVLNTIETLECSSCEPKDKLTLGQLMVEVKRGTKSVLPGSDLAALVDEFSRVNSTQDEDQIVSRYACIPVPICAGDYIKNIDVVVQQMKARVNNACPTCSASIFIQMPLNKLVDLFLNGEGDPYSPTSEFAREVGKPVKSGGQLEEIISECGKNHKNANNKNCISVLFCVDDPSQSVFDFANVKLAACSQYCPKSFHEHEISLHPSDQELVVAGLNPNDELPPAGKYFQDTLMVMESFKTFAPIVSDGSISPKAITQTTEGNYYYNYSHDVSRIHNIKDSTLLFRHEDWDNDNYWFVDAAENGIKNEFIISHNRDTFSFAAPLESDSLLHFTYFAVRDSFLYLSGYYTGALRYRAELVNDNPTHAHINGFVLRINQQGDLRGVAIIENINTTLNGFRVELAKQGDVLVVGRVKSEALVVNQTEQATGLIGGGFMGSLNAQTHAFSLISKIDLVAGANILRAAVEPDQSAYALVLGNVNSIAAQSGSIQVSSGNKMAVLALSAQGALSWARYFNGNIDPTQLDVTYGYAQQLNVGITYSGVVSVDTTQYFNSVGKQDIGLIQFDQQGQYRWHRSYGSPETETVVELLYDEGILYFGGNFAGAQGFRSIGGYDFYNPTPFHERAYVSYYADSIAVDSTLANTPELAALSAPILQKSSTPDRTFKVFPNPFKDEILTEFESQTSENMSIEVLNELGRVVKTQRFSATPGFNRQQISTQQFPAGIYFIYLRNQAGQVLKVQKLVKM
ncbi:T9SS type A sorting domain-containing protein [Haliscomenobacter hydrossis]|uniref:Secretion system C-terminal sorting domain-containing protein n=1 Tax=Haliscomenobacter hydrossis (strain ATCC 27775 / DSM 1100 / LMG 10767 / O) TaxID=760192 RepID=F4KQ36_HALH1|nr:T9SS type A sorting domain-containing protein [Haliscomenobacter hydrossis]AEE54197.1 hypothetical protein Halhy_6378 [Haliscomenobacter hydrossis DSM 1100]